MPKKEQQTDKKGNGISFKVTLYEDGTWSDIQVSTSEGLDNKRLKVSLQLEDIEDGEQAHGLEDGEQVRELEDGKPWQILVLSLAMWGPWSWELAPLG